MTDHPIRDVAHQAIKLVREEGATVHQKWTCKHCGSRQTMETPNQFYASGTCEECQQVTSITHCNFMAILGGFTK